MYVCMCHAITERHIEEAVDAGATRFKDLRSSLRVATECGRCASCAKDCLKQTLALKASFDREARFTLQQTAS